MESIWYHCVVMCILLHFQDPLAGVIPRSLHQLFEKIEAQVRYPLPYLQCIYMYMYTQTYCTYMYVRTMSCVHRKCLSFPFGCHSWNYTMKSCLTSYHQERTQAAGLGYLRTLLERQEEPPVVSGTYMSMGTLCPTLLLFVPSFHWMGVAWVSFSSFLLLCYTHHCVCCGVGFCCDPWAGGAAGALEG